MSKTIIIHDYYVDVLQDRYNLVDKTIYSNKLVVEIHKLLKEYSSENI